MKGLITLYNDTLPVFADATYANVVETLTSHMKNKLYYLHDRKVVYHDMTISDDFSTKNLNHAVFTNCTFDKCNLSRVSLINSKFFNCAFNECNLSSTNFRNSILSGCRFTSDNNFDNSKLGSCRITKCIFIDCDLFSVILDDAYILDCEFENGKWDAVSVYMCIFELTKFIAIRFMNMNFEYSEFKDIHIENTKLPFPTIPYIFGGLSYLCNTNDNVHITSQENIKEGLSKDEYLLQLQNLEIYYSYTCNYFPLTNIYIAEEKFNNAKASTLYGIFKSIEQKDYSMLICFAKLINLHSIFNMQERHDLYNDVISKIAKTSDDQTDFVLEFKTQLFNVSNKCSFHLCIRTKIETMDRLSTFLTQIESYIRLSNTQATYNIELRHNCPFELFVNYFADYESVCTTLGIILFALKGVDIVIKKVIEHSNNALCVWKAYLENKKLNQDIVSKQIDNEAKRLELEQKKESHLNNHQNQDQSLQNTDTTTFSSTENDVDSVSYLAQCPSQTEEIISPSDFFE